MALLERTFFSLTSKLNFKGMRHILIPDTPTIVIPVRGAKQKYHPDSFIGFRVEPRENHNRQYVSHPLIYKDADPAPRFMDARVRAILKDLTGCDHSKVFRHRALLSISAPEIVFFTDEQLKIAQNDAKIKADKLLSMPPVVKVRAEEVQDISFDPALQGIMPNFKIVFTDISLGIPDNKRIIVVRENSGKLRHANGAERQRMNEIYNPRKGRKHYVSELFTAKCLPDVLARGQYEFVLDRACLQFEPDEPEYQSVVAYVYEALDKKQHYDSLLSTRHYGPMLFFLVWHKCLNNFLEHHLMAGRLDVASQVVKLYCLLHQKSDVAKAMTDFRDPMHVVQTFVSLECMDTSARVQLALKQCKELLRSQQQVEQNVAAALGQSS
ncbi:28S ribosomal protein S22, mitochondrial [Hyalella azteca]|uniref:28S ribosomal protein S22, mitochondrial n=1 Tax=Hyalella azteca TaxID=294128 RepID=A0A8B7NKD9_HYAAZ|nr:28S ribosomal protein S22, mitochondrial [Hyalella azteca]